MIAISKAAAAQLFEGTQPQRYGRDTAEPDTQQAAGIVVSLELPDGQTMTHERMQALVHGLVGGGQFRIGGLLAVRPD
jgi:hypothetical protein